MTNLLATIVVILTTNSVERPMEQNSSGLMTQKETVTTVRELQTCRFEWAGKVREIHESRIVNEERKIVKLEWVTVPEPPMPEAPRRVYATPEPAFVYQTNRGKLIWNH